MPNSLSPETWQARDQVLPQTIGSDPRSSGRLATLRNSGVPARPCRRRHGSGRAGFLVDGTSALAKPRAAEARNSGNPARRVLGHTPPARQRLMCCAESSALLDMAVDFPICRPSEFRPLPPDARLVTEKPERCFTLPAALPPPAAEQQPQRLSEPADPGLAEIGRAHV